MGEPLFLFESFERFALMIRDEKWFFFLMQIMISYSLIMETVSSYFQLCQPLRLNLMCQLFSLSQWTGQLYFSVFYSWWRYQFRIFATMVKKQSLVCKFDTITKLIKTFFLKAKTLLFCCCYCLSLLDVIDWYFIYTTHEQSIHLKVLFKKCYSKKFHVQ